MVAHLSGTFKGILDSGATSSLIGLEMAQTWQTTMFQISGKNKKKLVDGPPIEFTFGNNQRTKSISHALLPGYVDGIECDFPVSVVDEVAPLLLGMDFLKYYWIVVDFELGTIRFKTQGEKVYVLERSRCGHLLIDFGPDAEWHEVVSSNSPDTSVVTWAQNCESINQPALSREFSPASLPYSNAAMSWGKLIWLATAVAGLGRYEILEDEATCGLPCGSGSRRRAVDGIIGESGGWHCLYHSAPKACPIQRI